MQRLVKVLVPLLDAGLVVLAYLLAFVLRFDGIHQIPVQHIAQFWMFLLVVPLIRLASNAAWGLYRHVWRYIGLREAFALAQSILTGSAGFALLALMSGQRGFPRSVVGIEALLSLVLLAGIRLGWRSFVERRGGRLAEGSTRTLVVGAGDAGELLVRDMMRNPERGLLPVGFVDDDPAKRGVRIHGVEVLGARRDLVRIVSERQVDLVVLAMPGAPLKERRAVLQLAAATPAKVKTLPALHDILDGNVTISTMRDVAIEDLLGRDAVVTDTSLLGYLSGKRVLVTGAGGSIGSELCRQIARLEPAALILVGHGENSVYGIDLELGERAGFEVVRAIADVRDQARIDTLFERHRPEIVFHAAAHKHVPLMEENEVEAVTNNVLGTRTVALVADRHGIERFVLVSTDKAVNPTSVMGKTKRAAELLVQDLATRSRTRYVAVRFGNVLGSRGSVVPLFRQQIESGGPVTVTHPEMRRYFMTIPEAVTLLLQAADVGRQGEVLLLEMGEPVRIVDLARNLIKLSGYKEDDVEIVYSGVRPGEKLFEELRVTDEVARPTDHPQIYAVRAERAPDPTWWRPALAEIEAAAAAHDPSRIRRSLDDVVLGGSLRRVQ